MPWFVASALPVPGLYIMFAAFAFAFDIEVLLLDINKIACVLGIALGTCQADRISYALLITIPRLLSDLLQGSLWVARQMGYLGVPSSPCF